MNLTKTIFKNSMLYFVLFFLFVLWGFWPTYYSNPFQPTPTIIHIHGILMTLWCLLLITQGALIRYKRFEIHKLLGKISYVLAPVLILTGISAIHYSIRHHRDLPPDFFYSTFGHLYNGLLAFAIIFFLAIWHRKDSATHARYMISTIFPAFTPVFTRIIENNFGFVLPAFPSLNDFPMVQVFGFGLADAIVILLIVLDWPNRKTWRGFPVALTILLCYHVSDFVLYRFQFWRDLADWVVSLPLS